MDKATQQLLEDLEGDGPYGDAPWQAAAMIRELLSFKQAVLDPENQPSQFGTTLMPPFQGTQEKKT